VDILSILIYTGITRAKKILVLVGTKKALSYAVRNVTVTKRNTLLKERLQELQIYEVYEEEYAWKHGTMRL
jgi:superfamily I DNA/RNA helicase